MMGDSDGIVSLTGAWKWIRDRKYKTTKPWSPWLSKKGELVGYVKEMGNFSFVTLHGQGHGG